MKFSFIPRFLPAGVPVALLTTALTLALSGVSLAQGFTVDRGFGFAQANADAPVASEPKAAPEKQPTEITATKETSFDERSRVVIFVGEVKVRDAQFNLSCDKLTVHLSRTTTNAEGEESGGGMDRAIAEGGVIIVQEKTNEKGEVTRYVGKARRAEYVAATGEVTLTGWPQIQQGINQQVATEEGTVMILNRDGRLKTIGGSKTVIKDSSESSPTPRRTR